MAQPPTIKELLEIMPQLGFKVDREQKAFWLAEKVVNLDELAMDHFYMAVWRHLTPLNNGLIKKNLASLKAASTRYRGKTKLADQPKALSALDVWPYYQGDLYRFFGDAYDPLKRREIRISATEMASHSFDALLRCYTREISLHEASILAKTMVRPIKRPRFPYLSNKEKPSPQRVEAYRQELEVLGFQVSALDGRVLLPHDAEVDLLDIARAGLTSIINPHLTFLPWDECEANLLAAEAELEQDKLLWPEMEFPEIHYRVISDALEFLGFGYTASAIFWCNFHASSYMVPFKQILRLGWPRCLECVTRKREPGER